LVALSGIIERQWGQSLVVGSAGGASSCLFILFIPLMSMNTEKATIRKLMMVLKKAP
jgi:hypothetical protein